VDAITAIHPRCADRSEKTDGASIHGRNDPRISAAPRSTATR
jgi:hypothetical protein